ncbi:G protein pathway suppressor 2 isoform X5 [Cottoperca gobio]|uniref:G protein pathway suppressor 2 isoform X5 n=1 Tax=Cottoperca gobio TaxID=56716 RepID=A0A6J2RPB6_COTGO|nr:G protein pathway suppressor 2 isoform X5 [Cottoperca gobio]
MHFGGLKKSEVVLGTGSATLSPRLKTSPSVYILLAPPLSVTMPALLERPKLSNAMARALHKHIMRERERKRQEEEEVDKMMEQKMKEEEERKRTKEIEERMSLEETKEQVMKMGEKLQGLQEEKHQLFLQLKKVLHEEEKRRRKEQRYDITTLTSASYQPSLPMHAGQHLLSIQGSPVSHSRPGALLGERSKQLFPAAVIPARHYQTPGFSSGSAEHGQFSGGQGVHETYGVAQAQHPSTYAPGPSVPVSFASSSQIRGASAFQAMQYLPHQQTGYPVHSHFTSQPGCFEAYASTSHASFCSRTAAHTIDGGPDSHCKGHVPDLSPECSSSRLPPPQPERAEVLPPWEVAQSHLHLHRH